MDEYKGGTLYDQPAGGAVSPDSNIYTLQDLAGKNIAVQATTKPEDIFLNQTDPDIPKINGLFAMQNRELIYPMLSKGLMWMRLLP